MTITLQTEPKMTQLVSNVENLYASIKSHYNIIHSERSQGDGLTIQFGAHPVKEHCIKFSSYHGGKAELRITNVHPDFIKRVTGLRPTQIGDNETQLRKAQGNYVANAYAKTFQDKIDTFFGNDAVRMDIDTYMGTKCALIIDISELTSTVVNAVSDVLKHSRLTPLGETSRQYSL